MNRESIAQMAKHHCWESITNTESWFNIVMEGINDYKSDAVKPYMNLFFSLIDIEDDIMAKRMDEGVDFFLKLMKNNLSQQYNRDKQDTLNRLVELLRPEKIPNNRFYQLIVKQRGKFQSVLSAAGYN